MSQYEILLSTVAGALVVVSGALYALCFALGRLRGSVLLGRAAWLAYGVLATGMALLAYALRLDGIWLLTLAALLTGYLFAPRAIWHLCVATHGDAQDLQQAGRDRRE
jgi:hypothetical protein